MDWYTKRMFERLFQHASEILPDLEAIEKDAPTARQQRIQMFRYALLDAAEVMKELQTDGYRSILNPPA